MKAISKIFKSPHIMLAPFVALASISYVFRFPSNFGEISLFRVSFAIYLIYILYRIIFYRNIHTEQRDIFRLLMTVTLIATPALIDLLFFTKEESLIRSIYAFFGNLAFFTVFALAVDGKYFTYYLKWYCYASILESFVALYAYFTLEFPLDFLIKLYGSDYVQELNMININDDFVRLTGTFFDPNFYGIYLISVIASSVWLYLYRGRNLFFVFLCALSCFQLVLTGSRTSLASLAGVIFVFTAYRGINIKRVFLITLLISLTFLIATFFNPILASKIFDSASTYDRLEFIQRGINAFIDNPFFGGGSVALVDPETGRSTAHSVYLSILGRNGFFGLTLFIIAIAIFSYPLLDKRRIVFENRHYVAQFMLMIGISFIPYDTLYFFEPLYFQFAMMFVCMKHSANSMVVRNSCIKMER